ncbi:MAG: hypothetical protein CM15mP32_3340 [Flavobacteriaceae bacterium]|nr:MAG: hypothetical protein CM15mP32_3340 [Flavobacteriaceae bacterium]
MLGLISLVSISTFMSIMFPTIYGIALEVWEMNLKLVLLVSYGYRWWALMPVAQGWILDWGGDGFADLNILGLFQR